MPNRDLDLEKNSAHSSTSPHHETRGKSTGPCTPGGKATSNLNAIQHGCRSEKTVLRDEDPAEFEATVAAWFHLYEPRDLVAITLVEKTARAHWFLKRASKRLEEVEWELPANAWHWTDEHQKLYTNFSRYKTTAERSFLRFFKELQIYYKRLDSNRWEIREKAMAELAAVENQASHVEPVRQVVDAATARELHMARRATEGDEDTRWGGRPRPRPTPSSAFRIASSGEWPCRNLLYS